MKTGPSLDALWNSALVGQRHFDAKSLMGLPEAARRYLEHAIAPDARLASAVRLQMHGEIKLKQWYPFTAEQVVRADGDMLWQASVSQHGIPIRGFDSLVNGEGAMQWKLLGLVPVMTFAGPDITRSAAGRVLAESVWLPSVLCAQSIGWRGRDRSTAQARMTVCGETAELTLTIDDGGRLVAVTLPRWGSLEGAPFRYVDFGGIAEADAAFHGYTIPARLRIGYYVGTSRFEPEGEFFRVTIDDAIFR